MNMFSLRTVIDDILLIVRNNNISESEDLSRDQIASWVLSYKSSLAKKQADKDKEDGSDVGNDDSLQSSIGPLELETDDTYAPNKESACVHRKRTKEKLPELLGDSGDNIVSVSDQNGCVLQVMNDKRRHFHYYRRYTYGEPTCYYDSGYMYVEGYGIDDIDKIYIDGNFSDNPDGEGGEDDIKIPSWMIPDIRALIMKNELSFMLNRPSDDSNNSTLASVKPHGPQDQEE